jgi:DNA uptake protein ComE-like DNA-binding protein
MTCQCSSYTLPLRFSLTRHQGRQTGYVLVIVLGLLSTLFIMALSLGAAVRSDLAQSRRFQDETAAEFLAAAGVEWVIHRLNELARHDRLWHASWQDEPAQFQHRPLGPGVFEVTYVDTTDTRHYGLQDEERRINLNRAPPILLAALPGLTAAAAQAIVTQRQQQPFVTPEDLMGRAIVSPQTLYGTAAQAGMAPYVTVWGSGKININTVSLPVLSTLPGMTSAVAVAILRHRQGADGQAGTADDRYFRTLADLRQVQEVDQETLARLAPFLTVTPTAFRVMVTGRIHSGQEAERVHKRLAIIDRASPGVRIPYWRRLQ